MTDKELMQQALYETYQCSSDLKEVCARIQEQILEGNDGKVIENMRPFLEGLGSIAQALFITQPIHREHQLKIDLTQLPPVLDPLVEALENRDFGSLDEILNYEFLPLLNRWSDQLAQIEPTVTASENESTNLPA